MSVCFTGYISLSVSSDICRYDVTSYWDAFAASVPAAVLSRLLAALMNKDGTIRERERYTYHRKNNKRHTDTDTS
jgi:hypothetical protein